MKTLIVLILAAVIHIPVSGQKKSTSIAAEPARYQKVINSGWTFNYFPAESADKGCEGVSFDDSRWPVVSIPHTWSTYETTGELHPFIRNASEKDNPYWWNGWGWYRKHFSVNDDHPDRKIFIEFEGVQKYCKVWINGVYLGDHMGGYGSFDFDLTPHVKKGDNVIAVAVSNRRDDSFRIPPMTAGNFNVYGGIYRDVTISVKNRVYIPMQGSAAHEGGTFITTPGVTAASGTARVQTWVKNDKTEATDCILTTMMYDPDGKLVQAYKAIANIKPGELYRFDQTMKPVRNPKLWSSDNPYLYSIVSEVSDGKTVTDSYKSTFGFRWFRWDYNENFLYLNGEKTILHGGNRHQEYPWLGDAIPKWITEMDFFDMAVNMKYNFMRTAHYPNDRLVYDLTDKYGIIVDEEVPNIKNLDFSPEVQKQQLVEMIRRDRNHPSILFWSMGNETNKAVDSKFAIEEDTTRILTARRVNNGSQGTHAKHNDDNLHIEHLLRCNIRGWYNTDVKNLEPEDVQHSGTEEHQFNKLIESGNLGTGNLCTWLYEDHGADREYLNSPMLHVNPKGYVDVYRIPKYSYYLWQANYATEPMVFILPHFWRRQYAGEKKDITVVSNCENIELMVNGVSKGVLVTDKSNFNAVVFKDITVEDGAIEAKGTMHGKTVSHELKMAGTPARIVLTTQQAKLPADRASVAIVMADIVDSRGNHVYGATNTLRWNVTGPAKLVGAAVYESDIDRHHEMEGVWYIDAPVANVIRSTGEAGTIRVSVSASGLSSGSVEITAENIAGDESVISEPVLSSEGRREVTRAIATARTESIPAAIKTTFSDIKTGGKSRAEYRSGIGSFILKENPGLDTTGTEFRSLIDLFASQLENNDGVLIADDYNFNASHFNKACLITGYINATKLPAEFKVALRQYYAEEVIMKGNEKNPADEMNWLNWIPSGGTVIYAGTTTSPLQGIAATEKTALADVIAKVHPQFTSFSPEGKQRALEFIDKMNPYVNSAIVTEVVDGKKSDNVTFEAEKGKPVLIPLFKFIAE